MFRRETWWKLIYILTICVESNCSTGILSQTRIKLETSVFKNINDIMFWTNWRWWWQYFRKLRKIFKNISLTKVKISRRKLMNFCLMFNNTGLFSFTNVQLWKTTSVAGLESFQRSHSRVHRTKSVENSHHTSCKRKELENVLHLISL